MPDLPPAGHWPKYLRLAAVLSTLIREGQYPPGDKLPSEPELCRAYRLSRPTVVRALELVQREGLLESRQGSGWYVREPSVPAVIRIPETMPVTVRAMLETTLSIAWKGYEGDPTDAEAFWRFLTEE